MILSEIAELVCDKVGKTDAETLAFAKRCARRRHQLAWDSFLWKDSLTLVTVEGEVQLSTPESAFNGQLLMPKHIERVLAIRRGEETTLSDDELIRFFLTDPAQFEREGAATRFSRMAPLAIGAFITEEEEYLQLSSSSSADVGVTVRVREDDEAGDGTSENITLSGTTLVNSTKQDYVAPVQITKGETVGTVTVTGFRSGITLATLLPKETSASYCRVRLHDIPEEDESYLVLGKRKCPPFTEDYDSPALPSIDDALIALTQGDVLEKLRHYGKAQVKYSEGLAQLEKAKALETNQTANTVRLVPVCEPQWYASETTIP